MAVVRSGSDEPIPMFIVSPEIVLLHCNHDLLYVAAERDRGGLPGALAQGRLRGADLADRIDFTQAGEPDRDCRSPPIL